MKKNVFIDRHKRPNVVEDQEQFLKIMKELKPYLIEFEEDSIMKAKNYPSDCKVRDAKRQPIIVITYDKCTFSSNDGICKAWTQIGKTFLRPNGCGQRIMMSEFFLPFGRFNLSF